MKTKLRLWISLVLLASVLFSGCQGRRAPAASVPTQANLQAPTAVQPSPSAQPAATLLPTALPLPTQSSDQVRGQAASQAAESYFAAVSEGKAGDAADLLSSFSLMVFQITRGDAAEALQAQKIAGVQWSDLQILDVQPFDDQTVLVHVTYMEKDSSQPAASAVPTPTATATAAPAANAIDGLWPMRLERGEWRYNWNNVIDFRTLDVPAQTTNGITILPTQLTRYSDRIQLSMLVQNRTNEVVVFGQVNETLGTFSFGDKQVVAESTRWILNPLRAVPAATLEIKGLFTDLPDKVEIRKWNNYDVKPWFVFQL